MEQLLAQLPADTRARLVHLYLDLLGPGLDEVGLRLQAGGGDDVARLVHTLAGGAAMLQDDGVAQPARAMEAALLAGDEEAARACWPQVQAAAARSRSLLR